MALTDAQIYARLKQARIPVYAYATTLTRERQTKLAEVIKSGAYNVGGGFQSYVIHAKDKTRQQKVTRTCGVAAKEFLMAGRLVHCSMLLGLAATAKFRWTQGFDNEVTERLGRGYLAITDLGDNIDALSVADWLGVQELLCEHVHRGGALILGDNGLFRDGKFTSPEFAELSSAFEWIEVQ
jgi:hypothetical protein